MHLFYIDESGNTGHNLKSADQPIHWLVALGCTPAAVFEIESTLIDVSEEFFPGRARDPDYELHGSDLFAGRGECRDLTPAQRVALYGEILDVIVQWDVSVFVRGIHKQRHDRRAADRFYTPAHPHRLGMMYLVERIDEWLEGQQDPNGNKTLGLLVADEQREVDREIVESFASWRRFGTEHGYRERDIDFLIDTVHYVPSHDSWLIQLADCVAYIRNRYARVLRESGWMEQDWSESEKATVDLWRTRCRPKVVDDRVWP